jgi:hypothetical protein
MAIEVERTRRFTADEYERMVELGIFREDERLELIGDGYRDRLRVGMGERIAPADFADVTIDVGEVFA